MIWALVGWLALNGWILWRANVRARGMDGR